MASPQARPPLEEGIEEVDSKGRCSSFDASAEAEVQLLDNHQQNLSFCDVRPVDVTVRNLEVEVGATSSFVDTLKAKFTRPKVGDVEDRAVGELPKKKILQDLSVDFPAGALNAIIGGSGSGKVRKYIPHSHDI
jgi:ABC-type multidrug transport system fused ATPase/permease subunit